MAEGFLKSSDEILSVAEFSRRFKILVKTRVPELWIRGEVSNVRVYSSGHTYFTLKDADASVSAVLFRGYATNTSIKLRDGMAILAFGEISVYEARGSYQLVVKAMMEDGLGDLSRRFELLKKKLSDEGLFDSSRKIAIPAVPRRIAVVTSPTGAAIRDFLRILDRRDWRGEVFVIPSKVQGSDAAREISAAIAFADSYRFEDGCAFDLLVVTRGGGSLEDLFAFNEEIVARAVASCEIPVISAVGHEIDFTLSDFAADLRAETPSGAAEFISSSRLERVHALEDFAEILRDAIPNRLNPLKEKLLASARFLRLRSPENVIRDAHIKLDDFSDKLLGAVNGKFSATKMKLSLFDGRLSASNPKRRLELFVQKLANLEARVEALNIKKVLSRGFAIVRRGDGSFVKSATNLENGEMVSIEFADSSTRAKIEARDA